MRSRVQRAPNMFGRAAVVIDFGGLSQTPDPVTAQALLDGLRAAGVLPVALAYGTSETDRLAQALGLPLLAKVRAQYERGGDAAPAAAAPVPTPVATAQPVAAEKAPPAKAAAAPSTSPGLVQTAPVRSGQQVYADNRDLTVLAAVGAGAEVLADGSIHIYGALRGRALAGAQGFEQARIFCHEFHAELVAIAGNYMVLDEVPRELHGKPVQVWLEKNELRIAALD
jgi:septum site-determining protein MinC